MIPDPDDEYSIIYSCQQFFGMNVENGLSILHLDTAEKF